MLSSEPGLSTGGSKDCKEEKKKKKGFGGFWGVHGTTGAHQLFPLLDHCTSQEAGFRWFQLCQPILLTAGGLKPEARPRFLGIRPKAFDRLTAFADGQVIPEARFPSLSVHRTGDFLWQLHGFGIQLTQHCSEKIANILNQGERGVGQFVKFDFSF